eukprot:GILK01006664.1.p1 GENE.GILK01006664.1~~GILK01006664.1.p1  ORF type:complete len:1102 (+),score=210.12 GILK01006664.1:226-3531(+)
MPSSALISDRATITLDQPLSGFFVKKGRRMGSTTVRSFAIVNYPPRAAGDPPALLYCSLRITWRLRRSKGVIPLKDCIVEPKRVATESELKSLQASGGAEADWRELLWGQGINGSRVRPRSCFNISFPGRSSQYTMYASREEDTAMLIKACQISSRNTESIEFESADLHIPRVRLPSSQLDSFGASDTESRLSESMDSDIGERRLSDNSIQDDESPIHIDVHVPLPAVISGPNTAESSPRTDSRNISPLSFNDEPVHASDQNTLSLVQFSHRHTRDVSSCVANGESNQELDHDDFKEPMQPKPSEAGMLSPILASPFSTNASFASPIIVDSPNLFTPEPKSQVSSDSFPALSDTSDEEYVKRTAELIHEPMTGSASSRNMHDHDKNVGSESESTPSGRDAQFASIQKESEIEVSAVTQDVNVELAVNNAVNLLKQESLFRNSKRFDVASTITAGVSADTTSDAQEVSSRIKIEQLEMDLRRRELDLSNRELQLDSLQAVRLFQRNIVTFACCLLLMHLIGYIGLHPVYSSFFILPWCIFEAMNRRTTFERKQIFDDISSSGSLTIPVSQIPAWVRFPDQERVNWLNVVVKHIWPGLAKHIEATVTEKLQPLLADLRTKGIVVQFDKLSVGSRAPVVTGVKVYHSGLVKNDDQVVLDADIQFLSDAVIRAKVRKFKLNFNFGVKNITFNGLARLTLSQCVPVPPFFSLLTVTFMSRPTVKFEWDGIVNFAAGINNVAKRLVTSLIADSLMWPNEIPVVLLEPTDIRTPFVKIPTVETIGTVQVRVVGASGLRKADLFSSDPYCLVKLGRQQHKTKVVRKCLNPTWDEEFEFLVSSLEVQSLRLEVYDKDKAFSDDRIGACDLPLKDLLKTSRIDTQVSLGVNKKNQPRGSIHVILTFCELKEEQQELDRQFRTELRADAVIDAISNLSRHIDSPGDQGQAECKSSGDYSPVASSPALSKRKSLFGDGANSGLLLVHLMRAENLPAADFNGLSDPYCTLELGGVKERSSIVFKDLNPTWNQKYEFVVADVQTQSLNIKVWDKDRLMHDDLLGSISIPLSSVTQDRNSEWPLVCRKRHNSAKLFMTISFKRKQVPSPSIPRQVL